MTTQTFTNVLVFEENMKNAIGRGASSAFTPGYGARPVSDPLLELPFVELSLRDAATAYIFVGGGTIHVE